MKRTVDKDQILAGGVEEAAEGSACEIKLTIGEDGAVSMAASDGCDPAVVERVAAAACGTAPKVEPVADEPADGATDAVPNQPPASGDESNPGDC